MTLTERLTAPFVIAWALLSLIAERIRREWWQHTSACDYNKLYGDDRP
jgi:hypothetical protein